MPTQLQFRRGTTTQNNAFTGAVGEISIDTDLNTMRVHDGSTAGGEEVVVVSATQTLTNKTLTSPTINSATIAMGTNKITGLGDPTSAQDAATKAYIDSELSSLSSTTLTQGDTNFAISDSGTGTITATVDNTTHSTFAAAGITLSQGNFVGNLTGNASGSAATLATARAIQVSGAVTGTANFDGSAAINIVTTNTADPTITLAGDLSGSATLTNLGSATLTATIAANSVALGTDTTGNYVGTITGGTGIASSGATSGEGIAHTLSVDLSELTDMTAAMTGTDEFIVLDAGADRRKAANEIGLSIFSNDSGFTTNTGDITNVSVSGTGLSGGGASGSVTITSNATNANTGSTIVARDGSGNFSAGTITANLTGNASGSSGSCTGNAATATLASTVTITANNTANETVYLTFVDGATGTQGLETDTGLSYNPSTNVLSTTASSARYADLAERYTSDSNYEAGTVLVFGGDEEVTESTQRLDKRIAGIVSTDPAYLMNSALENSVAVGLQGRVPCKVVGEIRKGDLMVSSATPGHAEAWREESNPPAGSVIGKALENKTGAGADVIEVVVGIR
jgi:hypothetical protein